MKTAGRVAITVVAALLVGAYSYATVSDLDRNGELGALVFSPAVGWAAFALLILVAALVNRWWVVSIAVAPLAVGWYLHEMTDYVYPFHEDPYPALTMFGTFFLLCIISVGLLLRRLHASQRRA
jgi:hypothetical protein